MPALNNPILLYDGVCGLCNRLVQFTLRHDHHDVFRFASLQSAFAQELLQRHSACTADLHTFYVVAPQPAEHLVARSDAVTFVLQNLGGRWAVVAAFGRILPRSLRDTLYNLIARNRYKLFGKFDTCPLPDPRHRHKFCDP